MRTPHEDPNNPLFHWGGGGQPSDANLEKPLIAAINGLAVGVGLSLALQCQLRVMAEDAWIGDTHTKVGRLGSAHNLYEMLPRTTAAYLTLCNGRLTAQECYQQAIVNKVVPRDQLIAGGRAAGRDDLRQLADRGAGRDPALSPERRVPSGARLPMRAISIRRRPRARTAPRGRAPSARSASRSGRDADAWHADHRTIDRAAGLVRRSDAAAGAALGRGDRRVGPRGQSRRARGQLPAEIRLSRAGLAGECRPRPWSPVCRASRICRDLPSVPDLAIVAVPAESGHRRDPGLRRGRRSGGGGLGRRLRGGRRGGAGAPAASSKTPCAARASSSAARTASASSTPSIGLTASFSSLMTEVDRLNPGAVSIVSQSGGTAVTAHARAQELGLRLPRHHQLRQRGVAHHRRLHPRARAGRRHARHRGLCGGPVGPGSASSTRSPRPSAARSRSSSSRAAPAKPAAAPRSRIPASSPASTAPSMRSSASSRRSACIRSEELLDVSLQLASLRPRQRPARQSRPAHAPSAAARRARHRPVRPRRARSAAARRRRSARG